MSQSGSEPREPKRLFQGCPGNQVEVGLGFQELTPNLVLAGVTCCIIRISELSSLL